MLFVVGWFFCVLDIDGVLSPITVPMFRLLRKLSDERSLLILVKDERLLELTAGCLFAFETDGVPRLLEPPIRDATPERAAGCLAPLGTDGLVVFI